jgi:hypothetical protein
MVDGTNGVDLGTQLGHLGLGDFVSFGHVLDS